MKLIAFLLVSIISYVLLISRFFFPASIREVWRIRVMKKSSFFIMRILAVNLKVQGNPPKTPFILVSNHLSYLDLIILENLTGCVFIAKQEVSSWPLLGALTKACGTIFISRQNAKDSVRVATLMDQALLNQQNVIFFPEGTSSKGENVLSFKPALFTQAAYKKIPIYTASIFYNTSKDQVPAYRSVCWWGDTDFWPHFNTLLKLPRINASVNFDEQPVINDDPRQLAQLLELKVKKNFQPTFIGVKYEKQSIH